jgi:hypothetical protein
MSILMCLPCPIACMFNMSNLVRLSCQEELYMSIFVCFLCLWACVILCSCLCVYFSGTTGYKLCRIHVDAYMYSLHDNCVHVLCLFYLQSHSCQSTGM